MTSTSSKDQWPRYFEDVYLALDRADQKRMLEIGVVALATSSHHQDLLGTWLPRAVEDLGLIAVEEILLQTLLFAGFPKTIEAFVILRERFPGRSQGSANDLREEGLGQSRKVYGPHHSKLMNHMNKLHPDLTQWMLEDGYGKTLSRPGLGLSDRELGVLPVLMESAMANQYRAHVRGALYVGVSSVDILWYTNIFNGILAGDLQPVYTRITAKVLKDEQGISADN